MFCHIGCFCHMNVNKFKTDELSMLLFHELIGAIYFYLSKLKNGKNEIVHDCPAEYLVSFMNENNFIHITIV